MKPPLGGISSGNRAIPFTAALCWGATRCSLAETLVQNSTAGGMAPPASSRISPRMNRVQEHSSRVSTIPEGSTRASAQHVDEKHAKKPLRFADKYLNRQ